MMLDSVRNEVTRILMTVQIQTDGRGRGGGRETGAGRNSRTCDTSTPTTTRHWRKRTPTTKAQPFVRRGQKVGRNDPCPCGSGKKYKQCHGRLG